MMVGVGAKRRIGLFGGSGVSCTGRIGGEEGREGLFGGGAL